MFVLFGLRKVGTLLGVKRDECSCGYVGEHGLVRRLTWFTLFFVPVLPVWMSHGMRCPKCGSETKLSFLTMRRALKARRLPLDRPRPLFAAGPGAPDPNTGQPAYGPEVLEPVDVNPRRGRWDTYAKVWPALAVGVLVFSLVIVPAFRDQLSGNVTDLRIGDCFEVPAGDSQIKDVQHRPCTSPHDGEVFTIQRMPDGEYPTTDKLDTFIGAACAGEPFKSYVGKSLDDAFSVTIGAFYPTRDAWGAGDRDVTCYATPQGGITVDHSYRSAAP